VKSYVDILKLADLYKPKATNPRIADPITAPARLSAKNVRSTMIANVTLDRLSFVIAGRACVFDLGSVSKLDIWTSFTMVLGPSEVRGEGGNA